MLYRAGYSLLLLLFPVLFPFSFLTFCRLVFENIIIIIITDFALNRSPRAQ